MRKFPKRTQRELAATAYHEAGHAVVCRALRGSGKIKKVTIACNLKKNTNGRVCYRADFDSLAGTSRRLASCELDAELVTNAASASRTSSADTFLLVLCNSDIFTTRTHKTL